jgi:hypothetical protein
MARRDFAFAGHTLRVEAAEAPLAWLQEFTAPWFAATGAGAPERTITYLIDAREHARIAGRGPHPGTRTRPCFTLDSGIVHGRVWSASGDDQIVLDEERDVFYRARPRHPVAVEVIAAVDDAAARLALLRAVREYAMLDAGGAGWLILHAAAVCLGSDALVVAGPKRAGKTTLLLHALFNERGAYVSNDRVALDVSRSGVSAHGIPTIVSIRRDATAWFPGLDARLARAGHYYGRRLADRVVDPGSPTPAPRWSLSPPQLCDLLGVEARAAAAVAAVLFPRVETTGGGLALEELTGDQALDAWRGALFRSCPPDGMFAAGRAPSAAPAARVSQLVARVRSFACRLGPDAYADGALGAAIRGALARSP